MFFFLLPTFIWSQVFRSNRNKLYAVVWYQVFLSNTNNLHPVILYEVFLSTTNNLHAVVWFQVLLSNTNNLHKFVWFQVFLSNTNNYIIIIIIIIIMSCRLHGYTWPSLATSPYHSSPLAGLQGYIPYPHIAAVCMFELVVLLLLGHMWGSIGVHHLWARPHLSSSVSHVRFVELG